MIRLDATTRKLQIVLAGAITTNQLPIVVCYSDKTSTTYNGGAQVSNTNSTTAVDICAAPASSTVRDIDSICVQNADTAAATATIRYNDNGTLYSLFKVALSVGDQLVYTHGQAWKVFDSTGSVKSLTSAYDLGEYAGTTGGTTTAYTLAPSPPITAYIDGQRFLFKANATNTGSAATFAISGLSALPSTMGSVALPVGGLLINNFYWGLVESGGASFRITPYDAVSSNGDTHNGADNYLDNQVSRAMLLDCGYTVVDKGNISNATVTFDYTGGSYQTFTATGSTVTWAFSNWPPTGNTGYIEVTATNAGAYTQAISGVTWIKPDGTTTTTLATYLAANTGRTAFQTSGIDKVLFWSRDAGTTIYGKLI